MIIMSEVNKLFKKVTEYNYLNILHIISKAMYVPSFQAHESENLAMSRQQQLQPLPPIQQQPQHHVGGATTLPPRSSKFPRVALVMVLRVVP